MEPSTMAGWVGGAAGLASAIVASVHAYIQKGRNDNFEERLDFITSKDIHVNAVGRQPLPEGIREKWAGDRAIRIDVINNSPKQVVGIMGSYLRTPSDEKLSPIKPSSQTYVKPFEARDSAWFLRSDVEEKLSDKSGEIVELVPFVEDHDGDVHEGKVIEVEV